MSGNARLLQSGRPIRQDRGARAFTLVELLVAMTILLIVIGVVVQITNQTSAIWRNSASRIQAFQEGRAGFEAMTRNLSQATLHSYYDYYDAANNQRSLLAGTALANFTPATYDHASDLHFISGQAATLLKASPTAITTQTHAVFFQAPLGYSVAYRELDNALNACGYFLRFDDAASMVPDHVRNTPGYKPRYRFRLMEMTQSTENLSVYTDASAAGQNHWFVDNAAANSRVIAENVIALVLLPRLSPRQDDPTAAGGGVSLAPHYNYNSRIPLGKTDDPAWPGATPPFPPDGFTAYPAGDPAPPPVQATRHHQLPPLMRVVMIVIDETSAARLQGDATTPPKAIDLSQTNLFTDALNLDADIQAVEAICNAKSGNLTGNTQPLTYRVFSTDILLRDAK